MPTKKAAARVKPTKTAPRRSTGRAASSTTKTSKLAAKTDRTPSPVHTIFIRKEDAGGVRVDGRMALTLSTYWACVSLISTDLATAPLRVYERLPSGGRQVADQTLIDWVLHCQANPEMTAFAARQALVQYAITRGNGVAEIERDNAGRPVWFWPLEPHRVYPDRTSRGQLVYVVTNNGGPDTVLLPQEVIHIKGLGDGVWGYSVLEFAARTLGIAIAKESYAGRLFNNDGRPSGWIEKKGRLGEPARKRYRDDWKRIHTGNPNEIAILEEGDLFHELTAMSPEDAKLIEGMKASAADICRFFRVPPAKVGLLDRATWGNYESQQLDYVVGTLVGMATGIEKEINLKMFGPVQQSRYYAKHQLNSLLRGDGASRAAFYQSMIGAGLMSPDEGRELEDMNPIPQGKTFFVPANWQTLERAVEGPPPQPTPTPATDPEAEDPEKPPAIAGDDEDESDDDGEQLRPVFLDAARRIVRREGHRSIDALKRLAAAEDLARWQDEFLSEHRGYFVKTFTPCLQAAGIPAAIAAAVLDVEAADHCSTFAVRFDAYRTFPEGGEAWETPAAALADRVLAKLAVLSKLYPE